MLTRIRTEVTAQGDSRVRRAWYHNPRSDVVLIHDARTGAFLSFEIEWDGRGGRRAYVTWARGPGSGRASSIRAKPTPCPPRPPRWSSGTCSPGPT